MRAVVVGGRPEWAVRPTAREVPHSASCYPSDLSDAEWALLEPLLPAAKSGGRPRSVDLREIINAISYWLRGGVAWRALPHDFPPCKTVYHYWRAWRLSGDWERIHALLRVQHRWVDMAYQGNFKHWVEQTLGWSVAVVRRPRRWVWVPEGQEPPPEPPEAPRGFQVLPRRWVVERTFGRTGRWRRTSKDYEYLPTTSECVIYAVMTRVMLRRLAACDG